MVANITDSVAYYLSQYADFHKSKLGKTVPELRKNGIETFERLGFPTTRNEEWKYTNVAELVKTRFRPVDHPGELSAEAFTQYTYGEVADTLLVFVDGAFVPGLSRTDKIPAGIKVGSIADLLQGDDQGLATKIGTVVDIEKHPFAALNTAFFQDGAYLHVPKNVVLEKPLHCLYITTAPKHVSHLRNLYVIDGGAQAQVIETFLGTGWGPAFTNLVTEVSLGENSTFEHIRLNFEGEKTTHISLFQSEQARDSNFTSHVYCLGGELTRNDLNSHLGGQGCECHLNGLYLTRGKQHVDNHTLVEHAYPHCHSNEFYKGILDDQSRAVFNGKIYVHQIAQKTDALQSNKNLLLSGDSRIDTKPQLEIFADDVRCTHGATIGTIDQDALFYLRARGIPEAQARQMLTKAFAADLTHRVKYPVLHAFLDDYISQRLRGIQE